jgi:hypothetical protein
MRGGACSMQATVDASGRLELHASWSSPLKLESAMWFGAVRMGKSYNSYHLMPIYTHPDLAQSVPPALRKWMQGKSCFNFRSLDAALLDDLRSLTEKSARAYAQHFDARAIALVS